MSNAANQNGSGLEQQVSSDGAPHQHHLLAHSFQPHSQTPLQPGPLRPPPHLHLHVPEEVAVSASVASSFNAFHVLRSSASSSR
jgi:hypothetical protein